jgi:hypothetical protein
MCAAGVSDNGIKGSWSRSGVDVGVDVAWSVAGGAARRVKLSGKMLTGGGQNRLIDWQHCVGLQ